MDARKELARAAERGDLEETRRLLAAGAAPEGARDDSPLRLAARGGHTEVVRALLAAHAEPPAEDSRWSSPTFDAVEGGHEATARVLLEGSSFSDDHLEALAGAAIARGLADLGLHIIERGASPNDALREAAEAGHLAALEALLATGRTSAEARSTALFAAAAAGHIQIVRALIDAGADLSEKDSDGWSALAVAAAAGHGAVASLLEERGASKRGLLWAAARRGDEALLARALDAGESLSTPSEDGRSALHHAAEAGQAHIVERLLAQGAGIEAQDRHGKTPAALAASVGHLAVLGLLADRGASLDRALVEAASSRRVDAVELCLARGASVESRDEYAETALHKAAENGNIEVLRLVLDRKPKLDRPNINGWTPLMRASGGGHIEAVRLLLERGAAVNSSTEYGHETALSWAAGRGHLEVVDTLLRAGAQILKKGSYRPLIVAAAEGHTAVVARLCDAGADIEDNRDDSTALVAAARSGHIETVTLLLERGASIPDKALLEAAERGHAGVVTLLREKGAPLPADFLHKAAEGGQPGLIQLALATGAGVHERGGYWDRTPLAAAAGAGSLEAVRLLLDAGADPNALDKEGKSCVRLAQDRGAADVVRLLVSRGALSERKELFAHAERGDLAAVGALLAERASPDVRAERSRTALHEAAALGHTEVVQALLRAGARVDIADEDGWTALMDACDFGHAEIAALLLDAGADPFHKDHHGFGAFRLAERAGYTQITRLFRDREIDRDWRPDLFQAARQGDMVTLRRLADRGRPVTLRESSSSILHLGAEAGHLEVVRFALERGLPADEPDDYGRTPVYLAGSNGHLDVVDELLARGADPNRKEKYGEPLIVNAAARDHAAVVRRLGAAGVDLAATDAEGKSALDKALEYDSPAAAVALIELGAPTGEGTMRAALSRGREVVTALLARGLSLPADSSDARRLAVELWKDGIAAGLDDPRTAMIEAAAYDDIDVVRAFLERGMDPNVKDDYGQTALLRARSRSEKDVAKLLKKHGAKALGSLVELAGSGKPLTAKAIQTALAEGDEIDATDGEGRTALHIAAEQGEAKSVKALLAAGASPDTLTKDGETALLLALAKKHLEVARLLEKAGASLSAGADTQWSTAAQYLHLLDLERAREAVQKGASAKWLVHAAAAAGDMTALALAVELGGSASLVTVASFTAARAAAASGKREVLDETLRLGSPRHGVLHGAVGSGDAALVRYALDGLGADVNARDGWGRTALHEAMFGEPEVAEILLDAGADPNLPDSDGSTPLFYAVSQDSAELIRLLLRRGASASITDSRGETVADKARWSDSEVKKALGLRETASRWGAFGDGDEG